MALNWTSDTVANYSVAFQGRFQTRLLGVQSETQEDILLYDKEYYRDQLFAPELGTGRTLAGVAGGTNAVIIANGDQQTTTVSGGTWAFSAVSDPHFEESDSFTHTPPRPLEKTRTRLYWWSGPNGTGNVVGSCWADQNPILSPNDFTSGF